MENNQIYYTAQPNQYTAVDSQTLIRRFFTQTYIWMLLALLTTATTAALVAASPQLTLAISTSRPLFWSLLIAQVGIVILIRYTIQRMPVWVAGIALFTYAGITGVSLAYIFYVYPISTISVAFFTAASIYGIMAVYGTITKSDLSPMGTFLMFALLGGLLISLINIFILKSSTLDFIVSLGFVLVFAGLTAFDHQKLKEYALVSSGAQSGEVSKMAILGALMLYLDFINMFLFILQLFGRD